MARCDWRPYYGIIIEVVATGSVFVQSRMYGDRALADKAVRVCRAHKSLRCLGVVNVVGKTPADQQTLFKRTRRYDQQIR